jgi:hypothetical protein
MGIPMMQELIELKKENEIPERVLADILCVYEFGTEEQLDSLTHNFICDGEAKHWTTWDEVFRMRKILKLYINQG